MTFDAARIVREVVPPLLTLFLVVCAMLVAVRRRPPRSPGPPPRVGERAFLRHVAATVTGGFAFFLVIVLVFQALATGDRSAFSSALTGGASLLAIALPVWLVLSWVESRSSVRRPTSRCRPNGVR